MATYVLLPTVDGPPYYVNPELVVSLTAAPTTPAGTFVDVQGDAPSRIVALGTPAAVAALLEAGSGGGAVVGPLSTVYVEPPSPAGRGDNATGERGNAAKPFATLTAAFAAMQNGDTLELAAGTYAPLAGPIPLALTRGSIVAPSGAGSTVIDATGGVLPCLDFSGGTRELWNVRDVRLQAGPLQQCMRADGSAAAAGTFFTDGSLSFIRCVFIGDVLARYVGTMVHGASVAPTLATWTIDTCNNVIFSTSELVGGVSMEVAANNDDPLAPRQGSAPLGAVRFDGACVFPGGSITLSEQGSIYAAPGSVLSQVTGSGLTKSVPSGFFSQVTILGTVGLIDFSNIGAFPDAQGVVDLRGATVGGQCNIANAPGSLNTLNVAAGGATFGSFVTIGEATRADMRTASFSGGILTQLSTPSTGIVVPPTFAVLPELVLAPPGVSSFALPFTLAGTDYAVAPDYDTAGDGPGAVPTRTPTSFDVLSTAATAPGVGTVRAIVSYFGT